MGTINFDITHAILHAAENERVSGISRVQFNVIRQMASLHGSDRVRCLFYHKPAGKILAVDPLELLIDEDFNTTRLLQRLGVDRRHIIFPSKHAVRMFLRRYSANRHARALKRADVYISAIFWPPRMSAMGLAAGRHAERPIECHDVTALAKEDVYVSMGGNLIVSPMIKFATAHTRQGGRTYQMIHDLAAYWCPEYFTEGMVSDFSSWLQELVAWRPHVLCISEWTAQDFRRFLNQQVGRCDDWHIKVVPQSHEFDGYRRGTSLGCGEQRPHGLPGRQFVLCVGTLEARKNGMALLATWEALIPEFAGKLPTLVFAGKRGWLIGPFFARLASTPELAARVHIVEQPSDDELAWLYRHCEFTLYPSFYEGWGLPVGESAWFGKYCIASSASSVPEVCGDLIDYIDPSCTDEIVAAVRRALSDTAYIMNRERSIARAPLRTWGDVAEDIYRIVGEPA